MGKDAHTQINRGQQTQQKTHKSGQALTLNSNVGNPKIDNGQVHLSRL